ncbi:hypothetical protein MKX03_025566 [Papaver bracteatum]|nr:hypothetical protein MKX03_025566 [Papaver bracteatum]
MESNQTPPKQRYIVASPDKDEINRSYAPSRTSAYFDLLNSAYTRNLDRFKMIASRYDTKGDGLAITIERLKDRLGRGSLIFAAAGGSVNVCRYLLEELNLEVDVKDSHGGTPLCYGAVKGHLNSVEYLLEKGANPNGSDDPNSTFNAPLQYAVLGGTSHIFNLGTYKAARFLYIYVCLFACVRA